MSQDRELTPQQWFDKYKPLANGVLNNDDLYRILVKEFGAENVGPIEDYFKRPKGYWTLERCKVEALKYERRIDFQKGSESAYIAAHKNGWLDECCAHMASVIRKPKGYWTLELCKAEALPYSSRNDFKKGSGAAYTAAQKNGWIDECCAHMPRRS